MGRSKLFVGNGREIIDFDHTDMLSILSLGIVCCMSAGGRCHDLPIYALDVGRVPDPTPAPLPRSFSMTKSASRIVMSLFAGSPL